MGFTGPPFTWARGREGRFRILSQLDRALCNMEWRMKFPEATVRHLSRYQSDHNPFLIHLESDFIPMLYVICTAFQISSCLVVA